MVPRVLVRLCVLSFVQKCDTLQTKLNQARVLGMPWQATRWSQLSPLQEHYTAAVEAACGQIAQVGEGVRT